MNHPLDIKPGQVWTTRDGGKARIYATDGAGNFPIHGALWDDNKGGYSRAHTWTTDGGHYGNGSESAFDIIRPYDWRADLAPIWAVLRPEYEWVAMDLDGTWRGFEVEPKIASRCWCGNSYTMALPLRFPIPDCDWTETATQRPKGGPT